MATAPIYLDYNATTPLRPEVVDAMLPYLREHFGNPSSGHVFGQTARAAVATARAQVAALLGCRPDEIVFTSGGTEANNLAIRGIVEALAQQQPQRRRVVSSVIEHPATARPCQWLAHQGYALALLDVDGDGRVRGDQAAQLLDANTALLTVMHSNNETGVLQPIAELASLAHVVGALVHTDAAQSVGKVAIDVAALGVDALSVAGHKLYAPKGVGALYVKRGTPLAPLLLGAGHERGVRPGTENVASIVGLGVACELAGHELAATATRLRTQRDTLWQQLAAGIPGLVLHGHREQRLPNTLNIRVPHTTGPRVLELAPEIAASTGSACHDGHDTASPVIVAMGVAPSAALGAIRLTLGQYTTNADIERAAAALIRAYRAATSA